MKKQRRNSDVMFRLSMFDFVIVDFLNEVCRESIIFLFSNFVDRDENVVKF